MSAAWIAVDWGTSHVRLWPMDSRDRPLTRIDSDKGMGVLTPEAYEPTLLDLLSPWITGPTEVLVCGMAGARQGWAEAPYAAAPCPPPVTGTRVATQDPRLSVTLLPGIKQDQPADVMRGEETQIGGFLAQEPNFDGILCLPGTHTKWAHLSAGEVVSFRTFMTGELFALLSQASVLRHTVGTGWDEAAFLEALADAMSKPAQFAGRLFGLRAEGLLHEAAPNVQRARLSGMLIGLELAAARPYWLGQDVAILGEDGIAAPYLAALGAQGASARRVASEELTLAGLTAAYVRLKGIPT